MHVHADCNKSGADLNKAMRLGDRIPLMKDGRVVPRASLLAAAPG